MKKITLFVLALGLTVGAMAQKQNCTIKSLPVKANISSMIKTNSYIYPFNSDCATADSIHFYQLQNNGQFAGFLSGQNLYGDSAYAEKYSLSSARQIKGIAATMVNYTQTAIPQTNNVKLYSADFSSALASTSYNAENIGSSPEVVEFMFSSPVSAQNFACAIEVGNIQFDADTNYNLVAIATTTAGCYGGNGENSYSYSIIDTLGNMNWVTLNSSFNTDFDLHIFPIVEGSGLNSVDVNTLSYVFPNPASDNVTIASSLKMNKVEIFNMVGQNVYSSEVSGLSTKVNTSNFAKGTYAVKIYTESGVANKKLVVE